MDEHPSRIGPYRILEPLGRGGMGIVYRAEHGETGRTVALKTVRVPREGLLQSIRREIHALARLRHPGIVPILEEGLEEGVPWYAMELLEGVTLRRFAATAPQGATDTDRPEPSSTAWWTETLQDKQADRQAAASVLERLGWRDGRGERPLGALLTLARRLCTPLAFLHGEGVVHRDLKPDNVFVRPDGSPVLMDFGIVSHFGGELSREELEVAGKLSGTVAYMSPEQGRGELVDARADLYSLGCILYELCTGRPPFISPNPLQVLRLHFKAAPAPPSQLAPDVPPELDALILQLLAKEPHRRIGHAGDVAAVLARLGAGDGEEPPGPRARPYLYRPRFVGRERPLEELMGCLEQAEARTGGMVLVGGESGIGKTRLLMELASEAQHLEFKVLTGECMAGAAEGGAVGPGGGPLHPLRRALQAVADRCRELGPAETERLLAGRLDLLARYEPSLGGLLAEGLPQAPEELSPDASPQRLYHALAEVLAALAGERPLLLVLDDLQWADELTQGFLGFLVQGRHLEHGAVLVAGTYRTEEVAARGWIAGLEAGLLRHLRLERLEQAAALTMIEDMLALPDPDAGFVKALSSHSEGNAFFIAEYLRTAVAEGLLFRGPAGRWQVEPQNFAALPLPHSVRDLVGRRLQGLPQEGRALAEAAAVLGREADTELLRAVAKLGETPFFDTLDELLRRQVLEVSGPEKVRFLHDQLREGALRGIAGERLPDLHRTAAQAIEAQGSTDEVAGGLAHHWEQAGESLRAAHFWTESGHRALAVYAVEEAGKTIDHAVELIGLERGAPARRDLIRALDARSRLRDHLGRFAEAAVDAAQMAELARDAGDRLGLGRALRLDGIAHYSGGDYSAALQRYAEALSVLGEAGDAEEICETQHLIGWVHSSRGEYEAAMKSFQAALATPGLAPDSPAQLNARMQLGLTLYRRSRFHEARAIFEDLLLRHERRADPLNQARCKSALGLIHRNLGPEDRALALLQEARELFLRFHAVQDFLICSNNLGLLLNDKGRFQQSGQVFGAMRDEAVRCGETELAGIAAVQLSCSQLCRGDVATSLDLARDATQRFEQLGNRPWLRESLLRQAMAHAAVGDRAASDLCFSRSLDVSRLVNAPFHRWKVSVYWSIACFEWNEPSAKISALVEESSRAASEIQQTEPTQLTEVIGVLLQARDSQGADRAAAWKRYVAMLSLLKDESRFRPVFQSLLLMGIELALRQLEVELASELRERYRRIADPENLLQRRRTVQIDTALLEGRRQC